eukprot:m.206864 g.206864  ORF g.206864 m.206864 type:complete len:65 (-) comp15027_c2_seq20:243-437(-)
MAFPVMTHVLTVALPCVCAFCLARPSRRAAALKVEYKGMCESDDDDEEFQTCSEEEDSDSDYQP